MSIFNIHGGHSLKCRGASGYLDEVNEDRKVKNKVIELLRNAGQTVYDCTDDNSTTKNANLSAIVTKCNGHTVDLDVSIHLNAGGGHGVEVWGYSDKTKEVGSRISSNIAKALDITNRGYKLSQSLYVLRKTKSPAILIECCFVDSEEDYKKWNADKCAQAIVDGLLNTTTVSKPTTTTPTQKPQPQHRFNLTVDGLLGKASVTAMQQWLGTPVDGVVSGQSNKQKKYLIACINGVWKFTNNPTGSLMVKALQNKVGSTADGIVGKNTVIALQRFLGVNADGYLGKETAKALQRYLNNL